MKRKTQHAYSPKEDTLSSLGLAHLIDIYSSDIEIAKARAFDLRSILGREFAGLGLRPPLNDR